MPLSETSERWSAALLEIDALHGVSYDTADGLASFYRSAGYRAPDECCVEDDVCRLVWSVPGGVHSAVVHRDGWVEVSDSYAGESGLVDERDAFALSEAWRRVDLLVGV